VRDGGEGKRCRGEEAQVDIYQMHTKSTTKQIVHSIASIRAMKSVDDIFAT
jgi:hypothetical protein